MTLRNRSISELVEQQCRRWQNAAQTIAETPRRPVITISREPGSMGFFIARELAKDLGFEFYSGAIIHDVARDSQLRTMVIRSFDEHPRSWLDDLFAMLEKRFNLTSDEYLAHLAKMVGAAGKVGRAVIVGRGANFILPHERCFRVRIIAPLATRIKNVVRATGQDADAARQRIERLESERTEFVRHYFNADIADPNQYDLILNTEHLDVARGVAIVKAALPLVIPNAELAATI